MEDFAKELRDSAERIAADLKAGRLIHSHGGLFTREDIASRVAVDGGHFYPTRSCGPMVDALALRVAA